MSCSRRCPPQPTAEQGGRFPEIPTLDEYATVVMLTALVVANIVSPHCDGFAIDDAEWALLNRASAILAKRFQLDPPQYNAMFPHSAFGVVPQEGGTDMTNTATPSTALNHKASGQSGRHFVIARRVAGWQTRAGVRGTGMAAAA